MRKRADTEEGEEVVTAWRVVKRRMAQGDRGGGEGSAGDGRGGTQRYTRRGSVEGMPKGVAGRRAWLGRRASRGPRRSRSSRFLSRHRFIFFLSLPSLPRVFFVPVSIPYLFLSPAITLSLSHVLSLSFSSARAVYSAVNGQAWSTDPRMACSCLLTPRTSLRYPLSIGFPVSRLSSIFGTDLPFSPSLSLRRGFSLRAALPPRVLRHPTHPTRWKGGREEEGRTANEAETEGQRGTLPSYVLDIRVESEGIGREARERPTAFAEGARGKTIYPGVNT